MMTVDGSLGPWKVISVSGNLDAATTPAIRRLFADRMDGGSTRLLVDLSSVAFIDSSGLGVLIGSQPRLQTIGGELRVVAPKETRRSGVSLDRVERGHSRLPDDDRR